MRLSLPLARWRQIDMMLSDAPTKTYQGIFSLEPPPPWKANFCIFCSMMRRKITQGLRTRSAYISPFNSTWKLMHACNHFKNRGESEKSGSPCFPYLTLCWYPRSRISPPRQGRSWGWGGVGQTSPKNSCNCLCLEIIGPLIESFWWKMKLFVFDYRCSDRDRDRDRKLQ